MIHLDVPGDLDGVGYLKRRVINCTEMTTRFVEEGKVRGSECFYDLTIDNQKGKCGNQPLIGLFGRICSLEGLCIG